MVYVFLLCFVFCIARQRFLAFGAAVADAFYNRFLFFLLCVLV